MGPSHTLSCGNDVLWVRVDEGVVVSQLGQALSRVNDEAEVVGEALERSKDGVWKADGVWDGLVGPLMRALLMCGLRMGAL
jgi:hypothetical protein